MFALLLHFADACFPVDPKQRPIVLREGLRKEQSAGPALYFCHRIVGRFCELQIAAIHSDTSIVGHKLSTFKISNIGIDE